MEKVKKVKSCVYVFLGGIARFASFVATLLAMTNKTKHRHCEERSDEATQKNLIIAFTFFNFSLLKIIVVFRVVKVLGEGV